MSKKESTKKSKSGRGSVNNPSNRFERHAYIVDEEFAGDGPSTETQFIPVYPRKVVNKVNSPDVGMAYSMNPYQGCEHGCIYCYARNSHEYWGYSAGQDFESKVLVKNTAPELLKQHLSNPKWEACPIVISGNTDCYQPGERKFRITRELLKVFNAFDHPCSIITKNALILRDLDILTALASKNLVKVAISITTLDEELRRDMEPRTATASNRLRTIRKLSESGVPVSVMTAPVIPGLNDHELPEILRKAAEAGAIDAGYTMVRLNGQIGDIFTKWIEERYPDRAPKVLNLIASAHQGNLNDSRWGKRMKGDGKVAEMVKNLFNIHKKKHFSDKPAFKQDCSRFNNGHGRQLSLF